MASVFTGIVFDVGCLAGSTSLANCIQLHGGTVVGLSDHPDSPHVNRTRPDSTARQSSAVSGRPVLHYSWVQTCLDAGVLERPRRGLDVSVPLGYKGPLLVAGDGRDPFPEVASAAPPPPPPPSVTSSSKIAAPSSHPAASRRIVKVAYTNEEHEKMIEWALKWHDDPRSQGKCGPLMWTVAVAAGLFPGRTVVSLQTHFRPDAQKAGESGARTFNEYLFRLAAKTASYSGLQVAASGSAVVSLPKVAQSSRDSRDAVPSRKTEPGPGRVVESDLDEIVDDSEDDFASEIRGSNADRALAQQALPPPPASRLHQGTTARRLPRATAVVSAVPGSIFACSDARRATDVRRDEQACQVSRVHADGRDRSADLAPFGVGTHVGHKRFRSARGSEESRASDDATAALAREEAEYAGEGDREMKSAGQESPVYSSSCALPPGNGSSLVHAVGVPQRCRKPQRDWGGSPSENLCSSTVDESVSAPFAASAAVNGASETLQIVPENALVEPLPELAHAADLLATRSPQRSTDAADPSAATVPVSSAAMPIAAATVPLASDTLPVASVTDWAAWTATVLPPAVICGGAADLPVPVQACSGAAPGLPVAAAAVQVAALSEREWMQSIKERYKVRTQTLIDAVEACRIVDGSVARTAVRAKIERLLNIGFGSRFGLVELTAALARLQERSIGASDLWDVVISELAAAQGA